MTASVALQDIRTSATYSKKSQTLVSRRPPSLTALRLWHVVIIWGHHWSYFGGQDYLIGENGPLCPLASPN